MSVETAMYNKNIVYTIPCYIKSGGINNLVRVARCLPVVVRLVMDRLPRDISNKIYDIDLRRDMQSKNTYNFYLYSTVSMGNADIKYLFRIFRHILVDIAFIAIEERKVGN